MVSAIPLLAKEGWTRHQENVAKPPLMERTGWSLTSQVSESVFATWLVSDHPVCADSVATRLFLTSAATPPLQGGESARSRFAVNLFTRLQSVPMALPGPLEQFDDLGGRRNNRVVL